MNARHVAAGSFGLTALLAGISALGPLSTDMYLASLPSLKAVFATDEAGIQLTLSVFLAGFALAMPVWGPLADRYGRRPVLLAGLVLYALGTLACALSTGIGMLIAARAVQAVGACAGPVIARAIIRDVQSSLPDGAAGSARLFSHVATAMALAPAVAPIVGSQLQTAFGWQGTFWTLTGLALAGIAVVHRWLGETAPRLDPEATNLRRMAVSAGVIVRHRGWLTNTFACSLVYGGLFAFISGSSFVLIDHYRVPEWQFGFYFVIVVIGYVAGAQAGGRLNRSLPVTTILRAGAAIAGVAGVALGVLGWTAPGWGPFVVVVPMAFYMAGAGMVLPQAQAGAMTPFPNRAATASAMLGFTQMALAAIAGVVMAYAYTGGPQAMATTIALCGVSCAAVAWTVPTPRPVPR